MPHHAAAGDGVWAAAVSKLTPLANYYTLHIAEAARAGHIKSAAAAAPEEDTDMVAASQSMEDDEEPAAAAAAAPAPAPASSSSSSSKNNNKRTGPARIWLRHSLDNTDAMPFPPVVSSAQCINLLRAVRHPAYRAGGLTGKSLAKTLDEAMHPADRSHFLRVLLPFLAHLALRLPELFPEATTCIPLLRGGMDGSVTLSAAQCACVIAAQFFSLFPPKSLADPSADDSEWPSCNMDAFFSAVRAPMSGKHLLLFNYFARIENQHDSEGGGGIDQNRFVTFHRRCIDEDQCSIIDDDEKLAGSQVLLSPVEYRSNGCIEDAPHTLQIDFANKYIGGGVLFTGCVQEEIRFCLSPECLVSMTLCESMGDNECIVLLGPRLYSHYAGYGSSLAFGADCIGTDPSNPDAAAGFDEFGRIANCIVAIDAIDFEHSTNHTATAARDQPSCGLPAPLPVQPADNFSSVHFVCVFVCCVCVCCVCHAR